MSKKRQIYTAEFKAKIALMAIKEEITVSEICSKHNLQAGQVNRWKKEATKNLSEVFSKKSNKELDEKKSEVDKLYKKIGRLSIENEFLQGKLFP